MESNRIIPTENQEPCMSNVFYIVNRAGAIHACDRDHALACLSSKAYRIATAEEIAELKRRNGHQVVDNPIARKIT